MRRPDPRKLQNKLKGKKLIFKSKNHRIEQNISLSLDFDSFVYFLFTLLLRWRAEIASIEASKADAVKHAELSATAASDIEKIELRNELAAMKTKMEAREEELARIIGTTHEQNTSSLELVKQEFDRLNKVVHDFEAKLTLLRSELSRAKADSEVSYWQSKGSSAHPFSV